MKKRAAILVLLLLATMHLARAVDTLFINGNIYTADEKQPRAEAIAVKGDRIRRLHA
jgi:hypothetical protein